MKTRPVTVGYCHPGSVRAEFMDSLLGTFMRYKLEARIGVSSGPRIAHARNEIVRQFLSHTTSKWLWMLDTDMVFDPEILDQLLAVDRPVVGGLCFGQHASGETFPVMCSFDGERMERITDYEDSEIVDVDGTGAACLLIRRDVLETMAKHYSPPHTWFEELVTKDGQEIGEDTTFCIRAGVLGFKACVNTAAKVGHVKTQVITEDSWRGSNTALTATVA